MALGKRQRETLDQFAAMLKDAPAIIRLEVKIGHKRGYTREFGSGIAITVVPFECYEEGDYKMQGAWIADCTYEYTAVEKGKEIARYLAEQSGHKERVRLKGPGDGE